jgi:hypothetical protein
MPVGKRRELREAGTMPVYSSPRVGIAEQVLAHIRLNLKCAGATSTSRKTVIRELDQQVYFRRPTC